MNCPLCHNTLTHIFHQDYLICGTCSGIVKDESGLLSAEEEKIRYLKHKNDENDLGYQSFVSPVTNAVLSQFSKDHKGLDFGAGTGSAISKQLRDNGYQVEKYDPFFYPDKNLLNQEYDYIVCCEVMEHFYNPRKEFEMLKSLLHDGGRLFCMTHLYDTSINFEKWYYRNDPTHVFIYQSDTIRYIAETLSFKSFEIENRLITFFM